MWSHKWMKLYDSEHTHTSSIPIGTRCLRASLKFPSLYRWDVVKALVVKSFQFFLFTFFIPLATSVSCQVAVPTIWPSCFLATEKERKIIGDVLSETKHVGLLQLAASDYSPLARVHKETSGAARLFHWRFPYEDIFIRKMAWTPFAKNCLDLLPLLVPSSDCSIPSFF